MKMALGMSKTSLYCILSQDLVLGMVCAIMKKVKKDEN